MPSNKKHDEHHELQKKYMTAKKQRIQAIAEEAVRITGKPDRAYLTNKEGKRVINPDFVERAKLIVDTHNWVKTRRPSSS